MLKSTYDHACRWLHLQRAEHERGASLVEYALLVALIALVCVVAVDVLGGETSDNLSRSGSRVAAASN